MPEQLLNDLRTTLAAARSQLEYLADLGEESLGKGSAAAVLSQESDAAAGLEETLDAIRTELGDCQRCGLAASRQKLVYGVGNPNARLVLVGEAPGREEDRILRGMGLDPDSITDLEKDRVFQGFLWEDITARPHRFLLKVVKQVPAFWYRGNTWWSSVYFLVQSAVFLSLFGIALWRFRQERVLGILFASFILYMNLLHASLVAIARYSLPLYPPMTLFIAAWWLHARREGGGSRNGEASGGGRSGLPA